MVGLLMRQHEGRSRVVRRGRAKLETDMIESDIQTADAADNVPDGTKRYERPMDGGIDRCPGLLLSQAREQLGCGAYGTECGPHGARVSLASRPHY